MGLDSNQIEAINCIDSNLQIIACAGSGKTEVISQRIINILKSDSDINPDNIVAFTFTEKAAENMKRRIADRLNGMGLEIDIERMYVGTIHSFCKKILNECIDDYKNVQVLDSVKEHLFISKYNGNCGASILGLGRSLRDSALFSNCVDKMICYSDRKHKWDDKCKKAFSEYRSKLMEKNCISFSFLIFEVLERAASSDKIKKSIKNIKYLIVDEYQDVDDTQEKLISMIYEAGAQLCVVGDDDQTIYQFRGSNADNMIDFTKRYGHVAVKSMDINYRSDKAVVDIADKVISNNKNRLSKQMEANLSGLGTAVCFAALDEADEFKRIADLIENLHDRVQYKDIAVLLRKRSHLQDLMEVLTKYGIPCNADLTDDFFTSKQYEELCWIFDAVIKKNYDFLYDKWKTLVEVKKLKQAIQIIRRMGAKNKKFSEILIEFTITSGYYDVNNNKKYVDAFSKILDDFDSIYINDSWTVRTGDLKYFIEQDTGAKNEYRYVDLINEEKDDAVNIITVHKSKGLEFDSVIIPDLQDGFFPSKKVGGKKYYDVLGGIFIKDKDRFESDIEDERKLFYVAVTRAKRNLFLFTVAHKNKISLFLKEAMDSDYLQLKGSNDELKAYLEKTKHNHRNGVKTIIEELEERYYIDIKSLRHDLLEELYAAGHIGHFGGAFEEARQVKEASDEEVIKMAQRKHFDINRYLCEKHDS